MTKKKKNISNKTIILAGVGIAIFIMLILYMVRPTNEYTIYRVEVNKNDEKIQTVRSLSQALSIMKEQADASKSINAVVLDEDEQRIAIAYGIVNFNTQGNCGLNTTYELEDEQIQGYTNGCYGADGVFMSTEVQHDGTLIRFQQAGAIGLVPVEQIELLNVFDINEVASLNHYSVKEGQLMHVITTNVSENSYAVSLNFGDAPNELSDGIYYSYDGHYFYDSMESLIDDSTSKQKQAVNKTPYYFSYQFLSQQSASNYTSDDINQYIKDYLGFQKVPNSFPVDSNSSMLYDSGGAFIQAQNTYGVNAIAMLSLACNESDYGQSQLSYDKHNLFGHAAYDNSPTQSAASYDSVLECIETHANIYMKNGYFNEDDERCHGAYFGDKSQGMNVAYASDPYWGEKAAVFYKQFDSVMGYADKNLPITNDIK